MEDLDGMEALLLAGVMLLAVIAIIFVVFFY